MEDEPRDADPLGVTRKVAGSVASAVEATNLLLDLATRLFEGPIARVKSLPWKAIQTLDRVLVEIEKTVRVVNDAVGEHLHLSLEPEIMDRDRKRLVRLSGTALTDRVHRDRGSCSEIGRIYSRYLRGALDKKLDPDGKVEADEIFRRLREADASLFRQMEQVTETLRKRAEIALKLLLEKQDAEARAVMQAGTAELSDLRTQLSEAYQSLLALREEFFAQRAPGPASRHAS